MRRFISSKFGNWTPVDPSCTCYDTASERCVSQQVCNFCKRNGDDPLCNTRVGNRLVPRYQTPVGGNIYATPTNRFRNAMPMMPMGMNTGGFGMPMGNSGMDSYQNANGNTPIDLGGGQFTPISPAILGGIQITSPRNLSQVQLRKISYNVLASKFGRGFADKNTISIYDKAISPATGVSVYSISLNGVAQSPLFATDKAASFFQNFGIVVDGIKTPLSVYFNFGRITQPKQIPAFSPNPKGGKGFQNAVGLPNQGSFNPSPYNPRNPVLGRQDCKKCWDLGCECVSGTRKGIKRCICGGDVPDDIKEKILRDGRIIVW